LIGEGHSFLRAQLRSILLEFCHLAHEE